MATAKKTKRKTTTKKKRKPVMEASDLGVSPDHFVGSFGSSPSRHSIEIDHLEDTPTHTAGESSIFHKPLTSNRTSFWLGVGFGVLVIGVLAVLAWQAIRVDLLQASVLGL